MMDEWNDLKTAFASATNQFEWQDRRFGPRTVADRRETSVTRCFTTFHGQPNSPHRNLRADSQGMEFDCQSDRQK